MLPGIRGAVADLVHIVDNKDNQRLDRWLSWLSRLWPAYATIYVVTFTSVYPLVKIDGSIVGLFAIAGLFTYYALRKVAGLLLGKSK